MASKVEEPLNTIFTINCLLAAKSSLSQFDFTKERVSDMDDTIDECMNKLVEYQHAFFLHTSGVHPLVAALAPLSDTDEDLRSIPGLEPFQKQALTDASQILDDFLPSALMDAMENLRLLRNSKMAEDVTGEAAHLFCEDFQFVEGKLIAADEVYTIGNYQADNNSDDQEKFALRALFPRTSGEIRVLLS